jgi:hypothetical protein
VNIKYKVKKSGRSIFMECRDGCGEYQMVGQNTISVCCSKCHTKKMYSHPQIVYTDNEILTESVASDSV